MGFRTVVASIAVAICGIPVAFVCCNTIGVRCLVARPTSRERLPKTARCSGFSELAEKVRAIRWL